jgi:hypothetical protein
MFVQINPDVESYSETISTLKFAERVSGVELGAARSNKEGKDIKELLEQVGFVHILYLLVWFLFVFSFYFIFPLSRGEGLIGCFVSLITCYLTSSLYSSPTKCYCFVLLHCAWQIINLYLLLVWNGYWF